MQKFNENCVNYMYGIFRFAEKLNIPNCVNSTENCVRYMYAISGVVDELII